MAWACLHYEHMLIIVKRSGNDADGTCAGLMAFVMPSGEAQSREVGATYTRDGSTLTMQWEGAGVTSGTVEGDTFTMDNEGQRFAYRKAP